MSVRILKLLMMYDFVLEILSNKETNAFSSGITGVSSSMTLNTLKLNIYRDILLSISLISSAKTMFIKLIAVYHLLLQIQTFYEIPKFFLSNFQNLHYQILYLRLFYDKVRKFLQKPLDFL